MYILKQSYNPLDRSKAWDETTKQLVEERIKNEIGEENSFAYLPAEDGKLLQSICDILMEQSSAPQKIKIAEVIDKNLSDKKTGVKYGNAPWPGELYKKGLSEFRKKLMDASGDKSLETDRMDIPSLISRILEGDQKEFLFVFLKKTLHDATEIFYSHPAAWAEVGFPGPAYPSGYQYLSCDKKEKWEPDYEKEK